MKTTPPKFRDGQENPNQLPLSVSFPGATPTDPAFQFSEFYHRLSDRGYDYLSGQLTRVDTFWIGTIGRFFETAIAQLLHAIADVLRDLSCSLPLDR